MYLTFNITLLGTAGSYLGNKVGSTDAKVISIYLCTIVEIPGCSSNPIRNTIPTHPWVSWMSRDQKLSVESKNISFLVDFSLKLE